MARLFLSYAREDRHLIEPLALLLERAGHAVWWDRRIAGGADFSAEIARELAAADAVLVAWSSTSVASHWVKDEAAEGRDRGRLVPLLLDQSMAPLGFRQIQAVSLNGWNGRGQPPAFNDLLVAIDMIARGLSRPVPDALLSPVQAPPPPAWAHPAPVPPPAPNASRAGGGLNRQWLIGGGLLAAAGAIGFLSLRPASPDLPVAPTPSPLAPVIPTPHQPATPQAPTAQGAANIDGRWRLSWTSNGVGYDGLLVAQGSTAQLEVNVTSPIERQSVRQDCTIGGAGPIRITCGNVQVLSGSMGYLPDAFTLERSGAGLLTGSTTDPLTGTGVPVTARRE